jgi:hypothetical protein
MEWLIPIDFAAPTYKAFKFVAPALLASSDAC